MAGKKSADIVVVESVGDVAADEEKAGSDQAELEGGTAWFQQRVWF